MLVPAKLASESPATIPAELKSWQLLLPPGNIVMSTWVASESVFKLFIKEVFSSLDTSSVGDSSHFEDVEAELLPPPQTATVLMLLVTTEAVDEANLAVNEMKYFFYAV